MITVRTLSDYNFAGYLLSCGLTQFSEGTTRLTTLSRRNTDTVGDIKPLAIIEVARKGVGFSVVSDLSLEESCYVLDGIEGFIKNHGYINLSQKSFAKLTLPEGLDTVWKVSMEVRSDNTKSGNVTRIQIRSFKSIADYLQVNKASDDIITISK